MQLLFVSRETMLIPLVHAIFDEDQKNDATPLRRRILLANTEFTENGVHDIFIDAITGDGAEGVLRSEHV